MGVFVNLLKTLEFTAVQCTTLRVVFAALIFLIYTSLTNPKLLKIKLKDIPLLAATGANLREVSPPAENRAISKPALIDSSVSS